MTVAPEGRPFIAAGVVTLAVLVVLFLVRGGWWILPVAAWAPVAMWIPWFFRDPAPAGPRVSRLVLAPANGKVVSVSELEEPAFLGQVATRVSIFMSVFDVHVNRYPIDGTVEMRDYRPGRFFNATLDKASELNERMSLGIVGPHGRIVVRQIAGLIARRIVCDAAEGDRVAQGDRLGLIRFGSRVDTFLDRKARIVVEPGDRTVAGVTVIAEWEEAS